jgi:hypothetical protein
MRYELRIPVIGTVRIKRDHAVEVEGVRFDYLAEPEGLLTDVAASVAVGSDAIKTFGGPGERGVAREYRIEGAEEAHSRTLHALQHLESHLSFAAEGTVTAFDWQDIAWKLIPENDAERRDLKIFGGRVTGRYPELGSRLGTPLLDFAARATVTREDTAVPKAFWREAHNEFAQQRYIQAFYNFYFVIEGLFGRGRSSEPAMVKQLLGSDDFKSAVSKTLAILKADRRHFNDMKQLYDDERHLPVDIEGTTKLLVRLRNRLHHYSTHNPRPQGTPFDQSKWESLAWFSMGIATNVLTARDLSKGRFYVAGAQNLFTVERGKR